MVFQLHYIGVSDISKSVSRVDPEAIAYQILNMLLAGRDTVRTSCFEAAVKDLIFPLDGVCLVFCCVLPRDVPSSLPESSR